MKKSMLVLCVLAGCVDGGSEVSPLICQGDPAVALEVFGDGRDGDFSVPPGDTVTLTRDMYWRNLTFPDGIVSYINPNGFVIHVSGTLITPGLDDSGNPQAVIRRDGTPGAITVGLATIVLGTGYPASGTIGGASGSGGGASGSGTVGAGAAGGAPDVWPSSFHPGVGGAGGAGAGGAGGSGGTGTLLPETSGSMDLYSATRMRLQPGDSPLGGGAGGGQGGGDGVISLGSAGGAGGGNIVLCAREIQGAEGLLVSAKGGDGASSHLPDIGGGGGGGGGDIAIALYRGDFPTVNVQGGAGGTVVSGTGVAGSPGAAGTFLPFRFVL